MKTKINPDKIKIIEVFLHIRDDFQATLMDSKSKKVAYYCGYVPEFLADADGSSDDMLLRIDLATGRILNWKRPTKEDIEQVLEEVEDD